MATDIDRVTTFKIFVGNLPDDTQNQDVRKIFEEFGTVVQCECVGKKAFVHMEDDIVGKFAIGELQGRELNGNTLTIQESRKNDLPKLPTVKLLVKNIKDTVDARGLRNMFKKFGYVIEVQIQNGEGHVCLEAIGDIRSAINEMNGYKIEDMELSVEPAPIPVEEPEPTEDTTITEEPSTSSSPKKKKKNKGYGSWDSSWSRARQEYYASTSNEYGHGDAFGSGPYESQWINPQSPFDPPPERILRDPYAPPMRQFGGRRPGGRGFRGPMGPRGMPPRMLPPPMPPFQGPLPGRMPGRIMRPGMHPRGLPPRGPRPQFIAEPPYYPQDQHNIQRNNPFIQEDYGEEVFYEDEPISTISRSRPARMVTGANSIPIGDAGPVPRVSWSKTPQRSGRGRGGGKRGGMGRGKPPKFTAMTDDVAPGEKYPVPPPNNPGFRAPMKRPKEEVKRKVKKKKKPLVPAELPDYSVPVPELPRPSVPRGAVLKPFPPPQGHSVIDSDTFGGGGSASFFNQQNYSEQNNDSNQMDFTTDDLV